jgi:hypothetical protein
MINNNTVVLRPKIKKIIYKEYLNSTYMVSWKFVTSLTSFKFNNEIKLKYHIYRYLS